MWSLWQEPDLAAALQQICQLPNGVPLDTRLAYKLDSMGLVQLQGNHCRCLCQLYRQYFATETWTPKDTINIQVQQLTQENQALQALVMTDALTQVGNRRQFEAALSREWGRSAREHHPLALIMCDVDCFKQYNDTYGHQAGDSCLQQIAMALSQSLHRPADLVTRYGGEEFAVILPHTDAVGAMHIAERIRTAVKDLAIPHVHSQVNEQRVTLSLGVACWVPLPQQLPDAFVQAADDALYAAKGQGRDCVVLSAAKGEP